VDELTTLNQGDAMQWSEQIPTEPGWYWRKEDREMDDPIIEVVRVRSFTAKRTVYRDRYGDNHLIEPIDSVQFAGPIPGPPSPSPTRGSAAIVQVEIGGES